MKFAFATVVLLSSLLFSGCQSTPPHAHAVTSAPAMIYAADQVSQSPSTEFSSLKAKISGNVPAAGYQQGETILKQPTNDDSNIEAHTLFSELVLDYAFSPSTIELSDSRYNLPNHQWLTENFLPYIARYFDELGISVVGEGMDCDNISHLFRQQLALSNFQGGRAHIGDVACGILKTKQVYDFGGVEGDGSYHCLVLLRTNRGWFAIEPQTGALAVIESYPNIGEINWVLL